MDDCRKGNKVISKEEMFHTIRVLGDIPVDYVAEKGKMLDEIENLFSLMDFAHDGKISEEEFLRASGHYRRLGQLLIIQKWEQVRNGKLDEIRNQEFAYHCLEMVRSLKQELEAWKLNQSKVKDEEENEEEKCKDKEIEEKETKKGSVKIRKWLSFDKK